MIVLTEEQMEVLRRSIDPLAVCDQYGEVLGTIDPDKRHELINEIRCETEEEQFHEEYDGP